MSDARHAFVRWSEKHPSACWSCWREGVLWSTTAGVRLNVAVQELVDFVRGLERADDEQRAYEWAMSNAMAEEHAIANPDEEREELPF